MTIWNVYATCCVMAEARGADGEDVGVGEDLGLGLGEAVGLGEGEGEGVGEDAGDDDDSGEEDDGDGDGDEAVYDMSLHDLTEVIISFLVEMVCWNSQLAIQALPSKP